MYEKLVNRDHCRDTILYTTLLHFGRIKILDANSQQELLPYYVSEDRPKLKFSYRLLDT